MMWRMIPSYEGIYEISDTGLVKNLRNDSKNRTYPGKILKPGETICGYQFVILSVNGKVKNKLIHRLVAEVFIPNPNNLPEVNHKDGNKCNNSVENLEWCTHRDNLKHSVDTGLRYSQCNIIRGVKMVTPTKEEIVFKSMNDCCKYFGFTKCWLGNYIRKHGNPCIYKGFKIVVGYRGGGVEL